LDESLPVIMADLDRLEQVFINLLINARDAIEEKWSGGTPLKGDKQITLKSWWERKTVYIEVHDSGVGVPRNISAKIFEPFFTTKEAGKGTGLGLSISYQIVRDFGGSIRVVSDEGQGARFIIEFPVAG